MTAIPAPADPHVSFFPVVVTDRPSTLGAGWPRFMPAARVVQARDVQAGDLILADFDTTRCGMASTDYFTDPYHAHPTLFAESGDTCGVCSQIEDPADAVMLSQGYPWDCDPWEGEWPVLVVPAAQEGAHRLWGFLVSEANERGDVSDVVFDGPEPEAADWLLANSPLYTEDTRALVTAIRLLDPHRFGPNR